MGLGDTETFLPQLLYQMSQGVLGSLIPLLLRAYRIMLTDHELDKLSEPELFVNTLLAKEIYIG